MPAAERDGELAVAYARLLQDPDPAVHLPAAAAWCAWEDTHVSLAPGHEHDTRYDDPGFALCFARLVTHYWAQRLLPRGRQRCCVTPIASPASRS